MEIARELRILSDEIEIIFASYATGFKAFINENVIDMNLPENNPFLKTLYKADGLIKHTTPNLVIAHEEFAALAAAKLNNIPSIYISAWMPRLGTVAAEAVSDATNSIIIESPGIFPEPENSTKVFYTGPILRKMKFTANNRESLRTEMNIHGSALVITVIPGGWAHEGRSHIWDTVLTAFHGLPQTVKHLFWIGASDTEELAKKAKNSSLVKVLPFTNPIERYLAISDIVITKGTLGITLDARAVGVPTISLSPGTNPIDDALVPRMKNNLPLNANAVNSEVLKFYIEKILKDPSQIPPTTANTNAASLAAQHILSILNNRP